MKIKKGDNVIVIAGKDKGKSGSVEGAFPKAGKVLVDGINVVTRHQKSRRLGTQGQVVKRPVPIDISNVALVEGKKPVRAGYKLEDGKKLRISRKSGKAI